MLEFFIELSSKLSAFDVLFFHIFMTQKQGKDKIRNEGIS